VRRIRRKINGKAIRNPSRKNGVNGCLPCGDKIIVVGVPVIEYIVGSFNNLARVSWAGKHYRAVVDGQTCERRGRFRAVVDRPSKEVELISTEDVQGSVESEWQ
jgi:hypothetical protein